MWRNGSNLSGGEDPVQSPTPRLSPPGDKPDRVVITTGTRSIAALAARKRTIIEQKYGDTRSLYRPNSERDPQNDSVLSQTMLAKHNKKYGDVSLPIIKDPSDDNISQGTKNSSFSDSTLPPITGRLGPKNSVTREVDLRKNRRTRGNESTYSQQVGEMLNISLYPVMRYFVVKIQVYKYFMLYSCIHTRIPVAKNGTNLKKKQVFYNLNMIF